MADDSSERFALLNRLAEEFAARYCDGERPPLEEYIKRHPELADEIGEFFPAVADMEQVKKDRRQLQELPATGPLPPLERLGDFRIIREIGRGGMGVVYEAEQVSLGRHVAPKVLPQGRSVVARARLRFEREAKAAARLHHTNIVPVFGVGEHDGQPYHVMQFIQGTGLDVVIEELARMAPGASAVPASDPAPPARREASALAHSLLTGASRSADAADRSAAGVAEESPQSQATAVPSGRSDPSGVNSSLRLPSQGSASSGSRARKQPYWQSVARVGVQVADALDYAHRQGIVHRDVKPSNLLLDLAGTVWVTDFGLAKAEDQRNLTLTGDILGTLRNMPPEAFDGKGDARGDVYSLGRILRGYTQCVYDVAVRPDGAQIASSGWDGTVRLWDPTTGRQTGLLPCGDGIIGSVAYPPDGRRLVSVSRNQEVIIWEVDTAKPRHRLRVPTGEWTGDARAAFHPDGTLLAVGSAQGVVSLIDPDRGALLTDLSVLPRKGDDPTVNVRDVAFSPDGTVLAAGAYDRTVRVWDVATRTERHVLTSHRAPVYAVAFSADGRLLASADQGGSVRLWDGATFGEVASLPHRGKIHPLAFSPDGSRLAVGCADNSIHLWDVADRQEVAELRGHSLYVHAVAWSPDGTRLVSGSGDVTVRVWDSLPPAVRARSNPKESSHGR